MPVAVSSPTIRLAELIDSAFSKEELHPVLLSLVGVLLGWTKADVRAVMQVTRDHALEAVQSLERRGALRLAPFWGALLAARPHLAREIGGLREEFMLLLDVDPPHPPHGDSVAALILTHAVGQVLTRLRNGPPAQGRCVVRVRAEPALSIRHIVEVYAERHKRQYARVERLRGDAAVLHAWVEAVTGGAHGVSGRTLLIWEPVSGALGARELPVGNYDLIVLGAHQLSCVADLEIKFEGEFMTRAVALLGQPFSDGERVVLSQILRETGTHPAVLIVLDLLLRRFKPSDLAASLWKGPDLAPLEKQRASGAGRSAYAVVALLRELCRPAAGILTGDSGLSNGTNTRALCDALCERVPLLQAHLEGLRYVLLGGAGPVAARVLSAASVLCPGLVIPEQFLLEAVQALASDADGSSESLSALHVKDATYDLRERDLLGRYTDHDMVLTALEQALIIVVGGGKRHQLDHEALGEPMRRRMPQVDVPELGWLEDDVYFAPEVHHLIHWLWCSRQARQQGGCE